VNVLRGVGALGVLGTAALVYCAGLGPVMRDSPVQCALALVLALAGVELAARRGGPRIEQRAVSALWVVPLCAFFVDMVAFTGVMIGNVLHGDTDFDFTGKVLLVGLLYGGIVSLLVGFVLGLVTLGVLRLRA
jgi:hypothetical protein